jgi:FMN-dependent NADH-azoreductase
MTHILHIDASPRGVGEARAKHSRSISRTLSHEFISEWKAAHPNDTLTYRDLGHYPIPFVTEDWIAAAFSHEKYTPEQAAAIQLSNELVDEFLAADRYVFGIPMYNFSVSANFKAYLDQIVRPRRTVSFEETGSTGLVHNKKATIVTASGGSYSEGSPTQSYDLETPYLRLILGFMGITDVEFIHAEGLEAGDEARSLVMANAKSAIKAAISMSKSLQRA